MSRSAPKPAQLVTMVLFALSCFCLLLFLWISFGGPVPLRPKGYQIKVPVPEAQQLGAEADVRIAGVPVGKVRKLDIDDRYPNKLVATVQMNAKYAPVSRDARVVMRQKTLLGETYLELTPGTLDGPKIPDGGFLAPARVAPTVQIDEIFEALDPRTRQAFREWQQTMARALQDRGLDLNNSLGNLGPFAENATDVLQVLDRQEATVRRLVRNTGTTFAALTQNEQQLRNLITSTSDVFGATASRQEALAQSIQLFPSFLDQSKATLARLQSFSTNTEPLIRDLRPVGRDLRPTLRDVRALAPNLERVFENLDPLISVSRRGLPALEQILRGARPLLAGTQPFLEQLNPILEWLEYNQTTVGDFISNGGSAVADTVATVTPEERGHYLRQIPMNGIETIAMYPNRLPSNRGNAYPMPGRIVPEPEHSRFMIFANWDCDNTGKGGDGVYMTSIPNTNDIPSCFIQKPPVLPRGNTRKFPHIEPADYSK